MKKPWFWLAVLVVLCLPFGVFAVDTPMPGGVMTFSGELPEALRPAFADPQWSGWIVEAGQWQKVQGSEAVYAQMILRKGERRTLCALLLANGAIACFETSESALYPGRSAELEINVDRYDAFDLVYDNSDGTQERYQWFLGGDDHWRVSRYVASQGGQIRITVDISPRELYADGQAFFNTQSVFLPEFDAATFPKDKAQIEVLSAQSPNASADTALTRPLFDGQEERVALLREHADESAAVRMCYYDGVEAELLEGDDATWAHVRIGNQEGYMRREQLAFGSDKASVYPWDGASGCIDLPYPGLSATLHERPATDSAALCEVELFRYVRVLGYTPDARWVQVRASNPLTQQRASQAQVGFMDAACVPQTDNFHSALIANPDPHDRLNLRTEPRKDSPSLGKYYNGQPVVFLHGTPNGAKWPRVVIEGVVGYVDGQFLDYSSDAFPRVLPPLAAVQAAEGAPMYDNAAQSGAPIGTYPVGSVVEVMGVIGALGHVHAQDGRTGYMRLDAIGGEPTGCAPAQFVMDHEVQIFEKPDEKSKQSATLQVGDTAQLFEHGFDHWRSEFDVATGTLREPELVDHDWVLVCNQDRQGVGFTRWSQIHPSEP